MAFKRYLALYISSSAAVDKLSGYKDKIISINNVFT